MSQIAKLSVVIPVRDGQQRIAAEAQRVLDALTDIAAEPIEMIIVDDGSRDATPEVLDELQSRFPQIRVARHRRPLGMEAAGQTGLERSTGELVFIQEDDQPLRIEDLLRLYRMGDDPSVVAARAQSRSTGSKAPLLRRLRAWGAKAADSLRESNETQAIEGVAHGSQPVPGLQMVRRPHLQWLASRGAENAKLQAERITTSEAVLAGGNVAARGAGAAIDRDHWFAERMHEAARPLETVGGS